MYFSYVVFPTLLLLQVQFFQISCLHCVVCQDYQEEITVAEENKLHLHQLGERLARASHQSKATEIEQKLNKVSDRWQHLLNLIGAR